MRKPKPTQLAKLLILPLFVTLQACNQTTGSSVQISGGLPAAFCRTAKPIYWSAHDTPETIRQAKEQNAAGKSICGWK